MVKASRRIWPGCLGNTCTLFSQDILGILMTTESLVTKLSMRVYSFNVKE